MLRTDNQNRALHLMFRQLADELNDRGLTIVKTLKPTAEIPWNETTIKELIWRPLQKIITGKKSTTSLDTNEIDKVFEVIADNMAKNHSLVINFPSVETILNRQDWYELGEKLKSNNDNETHRR